MGINGLLKLVQPIIQPCHISKYKGQRVAVDTYCWLHKGAYQCSKELVLGEPSTKYINFCLRRVQMLKDAGCIPVLVFDGADLPAKKHTEGSRREKRDQQKHKGLILWNEGNVESAIRCFQKAMNITTAMAHALVIELKALNVEFVVAPYEADAQLAYLAMSKNVSAVITEDSDLLAFGCPRLLYKLDDGGNCDEIVWDNLANLTGNIRFSHWNLDMFQYMCILSGCDYLPSLFQMGLSRAYQFVNDNKDINDIFSAIKRNKRHQWYDNYPQDFYRALYTFQHQRVYDINTNKLRHIHDIHNIDDIKNNLSIDDQDLSFLGCLLNDNVAINIAKGFIDPVTKEEFNIIHHTCSSNDIKERVSVDSRDKFHKSDIFPPFQTKISKQSQQQISVRDVLKDYSNIKKSTRIYAEGQRIMSLNRSKTKNISGGNSISRLLFSIKEEPKVTILTAKEQETRFIGRQYGHTNHSVLVSNNISSRKTTINYEEIKQKQIFEPASPQEARMVRDMCAERWLERYNKHISPIKRRSPVKRKKVDDDINDDDISPSSSFVMDSPPRVRKFQY